MSFTANAVQQNAMQILENALKQCGAGPDDRGFIGAGCDQAAFDGAVVSFGNRHVQVYFNTEEGSWFLEGIAEPTMDPATMPWTTARLALFLLWAQGELDAEFMILDFLTQEARA